MESFYTPQFFCTRETLKGLNCLTTMFLGTTSKMLGKVKKRKKENGVQKGTFSFISEEKALSAIFSTKKKKIRPNRSTLKFTKKIKLKKNKGLYESDVWPTKAEKQEP